MTNHHSDCATRLTLTPNYKILALSLVLLPLLMFLGLWQLDRAQEKQDLLAEFNDRINRTPIPLASQSIHDNYTQVIVSGSFINDRQWLLDNKVRNGRVGYEVISPFKLLNGEVALVNRGWIEAPRLRNSLPDISINEEAINVFASVYKPLPNTLIAPHVKNDAWPIVINAIDLNSMAAEFGFELNKNYLRIDENSPAALTTHWQVINTQPEKHTAYAVQWFAMAIALLMLTITTNSNIIKWLKRPKYKDVNNE